VLKPGGVLAFHEWSLIHPLDEKIIETFADFMLSDEDAPPELMAVREFIRTPRLWDNVLQDVDDYHELLADFSQVEVWEDAPTTCVLPVEDFIRYKTAWTNRQAELKAMPDFVRADCIDALRRMLQEEADTDGNVRYNPMVFRVRAVK
jgi:hypothetical protein